MWAILGKTPECCVLFDMAQILCTYQVTQNGTALEIEGQGGWDKAGGNHLCSLTSTLTLLLWIRSLLLLRVLFQNRNTVAWCDTTLCLHPDKTETSPVNENPEPFSSEEEQVSDWHSQWNILWYAYVNVKNIKLWFYYWPFSEPSYFRRD